MVERVANTVMLPVSEYDAMCKERLKLIRQASTLKKKYGIAHDQVVAAAARAADAKHRAKSAENGLRGLQQRVDRLRAALGHTLEMVTPDEGCPECEDAQKLLDDISERRG